jgi:hypothetical protein
MDPAVAEVVRILQWTRLLVQGLGQCHRPIVVTIFVLLDPAHVGPATPVGTVERVQVAVAPPEGDLDDVVHLGEAQRRVDVEQAPNLRLTTENRDADTRDRGQKIGNCHADHSAASGWIG